MHTTEIYYTCHQLLLEELASASIYHNNVTYNKGVSAMAFYIKQALPQ